MLPITSPSKTSGSFLLCTGCCDTLTEVIDLLSRSTASFISTAKAAAPWSRAYLEITKEKQTYRSMITKRKDKNIDPIQHNGIQNMKTYYNQYLWI